MHPSQPFCVTPLPLKPLHSFLCQIDFNYTKYATVTTDLNSYQVRVLFLSISEHFLRAFEVRKCYKMQNISFSIVIYEMYR